jgi:acyl carrier protein
MLILDQPALNRKRLKAEKLIDSNVLELLIRVQVDAGCSRTLTEDSSNESIPTWDSTAAMSLMVHLESTFGTEFEAGEIAALTSIAGIRCFLRDKGAGVVDSASGSANGGDLW